MLIRNLLLFAAFGLSATALLAQNVSYLNGGSVEVGGFGGFATGLGRTAAGYGGNFSVAANKYLLPYVEATLFPNLLSRTKNEQVTIAGINQTASVKRTNSFTDFHGGVHLRLPYARRPEIMPYFAFGVGVLRKNSGEAEIVGRTTIPDPARSDLAVNFGGGLRWYFTQNVGTRIEVKAYKPNSSVDAFNDPFVKVTIGLFYIWGR